jgi:hypothetical protein
MVFCHAEKQLGSRLPLPEVGLLEDPDEYLCEHLQFFKESESKELEPPCDRVRIILASSNLGDYLEALLDVILEVC